MRARRAARGPEPPGACTAAHALDLVGDRWALLVMRELMAGPKRFSDIRAGLPGISANVLPQRLEWLESIGVLHRRELPPPAASKVDELTEWGSLAEPIFSALGRWAARSPLHDPTLPFSSASFVLSVRTMFDPEKAEGMLARVGFRIGAESFLADVREARLDVRAGPVEDADAVFTGSASALAGAIYGGAPLAALKAGGVIRLVGDRAVAARFVSLFPLPPKLPPKVAG